MACLEILKGSGLIGGLYAGLARGKPVFLPVRRPVALNHGLMVGESPGATLPVSMGTRLVCRVGFLLGWDLFVVMRLLFPGSPRVCTDCGMRGLR